MFIQNNQPFKKGFIALVLQWLLVKPKPRKVPLELQQAIDRCRSVDELKTLLFSMKGMNETALAAFDKRIEELEQLN